MFCVPKIPIYLTYVCRTYVFYCVLKIGISYKVKKLSASALNLQKTSFFVSMVTVFAISYKVKKAISAAIRKNKLDATLAEIQERFCLTPEREDRRLFQLSGERWRASAALGYAENKRIFYAPYNPSVFIIKCVSQLCLNHYMS